jgi:hypothetical protein
MEAEMGIYREGEKVLGYWGAMHPLSFGKIEKIEDGWCQIAWSDGSKSLDKIGSIYHDFAGACGCGAYFCSAHSLNDYPDDWFEMEDAA